MMEWGCVSLKTPQSNTAVHETFENLLYKKLHSNSKSEDCIPGFQDKKQTEREKICGMERVRHSASQCVGVGWALSLSLH